MPNSSARLKLVSTHAEPEQLEWSKQLEIGVPAIDAQHKRFFELAASLADDRDPIRVMKALSELNNYVRDHKHPKGTVAFRQRVNLGSFSESRIRRT